MKDHSQEMINRLLAQFEGAKKFEGFISVLGAALNALEKAVNDLEEKRWIDTAQGVQLDGLGQIVGQPRLIPKALALPFFGFAHQPSARGFGQARFRHRFDSAVSSSILGDAPYRMVIAAKIVKNTTICTPEQVIAACNFVFSCESIILSEVGDAKLRIAIGRLLTDEQKILANALNLVPKPGGVRITLKTEFDPVATFGFKHQGFQGFGQGKLAHVF